MIEVEVKIPIENIEKIKQKLLETLRDYILLNMFHANYSFSYRLLSFQE